MVSSTHDHHDCEHTLPLLTCQKRALDLAPSPLPVPPATADVRRSKFPAPVQSEAVRQDWEPRGFSCHAATVLPGWLVHCFGANIADHLKPPENQRRHCRHGCEGRCASPPRWAGSGGERQSGRHHRRRLLRPRARRRGLHPSWCGGSPVAALGAAGSTCHVAYALPTVHHAGVKFSIVNAGEAEALCLIGVA